MQFSNKVGVNLLQLMQHLQCEFEKRAGINITLNILSFSKTVPAKAYDVRFIFTADYKGEWFDYSYAITDTELRTGNEGVFDYIVEKMLHEGPILIKKKLMESTHARLNNQG